MLPSMGARNINKIPIINLLFIINLLLVTGPKGRNDSDRGAGEVYYNDFVWAR